MLQLFVVENGPELTESVLLVLGLVAGLGVLDEDLFFLAGIWVGELVAQTDTRLDLVDVLTAGAAASECVPGEESRFDLYFDSVVDKGVTKTDAKEVMRLP